MDTILTKQIVFCLAIIIGQCALVLVPYINKQRADGREFDMNYCYTAIVGYIIMATTVLNTDSIMVMELSFPSVMMLMFGGGIVQKEFIAKVTPKKRIVEVDG